MKADAFQAGGMWPLGKALDFSYAFNISLTNFRHVKRDATLSVCADFQPSFREQTG